MPGDTARRHAGAETYPETGRRASRPDPVRRPRAATRTGSRHRPGRIGERGALAVDHRRRGGGSRPVIVQHTRRARAWRLADRRGQGSWPALRLRHMVPRHADVTAPRSSTARFPDELARRTPSAPVRRQPESSPALAHHLGLHGHRLGSGVRGSGTLPPRTRGAADRGVAGRPTARIGVSKSPCAPPASRSRSDIPLLLLYLPRHRPRVSRRSPTHVLREEPRRAGLVVHDVPGGPRPGTRTSSRCHYARSPSPPQGRRGEGRGARRGVALHHGPPARPDRGRTGPVLPVALPHGDAGGPRTLLAVGGADALHADHGEGPRRRHPSLARLRPGLVVFAEGPYGTFTARRATRVLLIAGGIGITPLRAISRRFPGTSRLIYPGQQQQDIMFQQARHDRRRQRDRGYLVGSRARSGRDPLSPGARSIVDLDQQDGYLSAVRYEPGQLRALRATGASAAPSTSSRSSSEEECTTMRPVILRITGTMAGLVALSFSRTSSVPWPRRSALAASSSSSAPSSSSGSSSSARARRQSGPGSVPVRSPRPAQQQDRIDGEVANTCTGPDPADRRAARSVDRRRPGAADQILHDVQIGDRLPELISERLTAPGRQSTQVSSATYSSTGYIRSLQSALDSVAWAGTGGQDRRRHAGT